MDCIPVPGMSFREAGGRVGQQFTCFIQQTSQQHIMLPPRYLNMQKTFITQHLNKQLRVYSDQLDGVPVAYGNLYKLQNYGRIVDDEPFLHFDIQVDFIVFKPKPGSLLKAVANKIGRNHVGGLVHNCFNVSVPKKAVSRDGHLGSALYVGAEFLLKVEKIESHNGILSIKGFIKDEQVTTQEKRDFGTEADELPEVPLRAVPVKTERIEIIAEDFTMESSKQQEATPGDNKKNDASLTHTVNEEKTKKDKKKRKRDSMSSKSLASEDKPNKKKRKISKSAHASMDDSFINSVSSSGSMSGHTVIEEKKKKDKKKRKRDSLSSKCPASEDKPNKKKRKISKSAPASMDGSFINSVSSSGSMSGQFTAMLQSTPKISENGRPVLSFPVFTPEGIGSSSSFDSAIGSVSLENSEHKKKKKHDKTPKKEKDSKKKGKHKSKKDKKEKESKSSVSLLDSGQFS